MIRPRIHEAKLSQQTLLDYMHHYEYPHLENHRRVIDYAFVVTCEAGDEIAGFMWCYLLDDDETRWSCHTMVTPKYQKRFFTRRLMNTVFSVAWVSGVNTLVVENSHQELLLRMGGRMTDDGAELDLPHKWG